MAGLGQVTLKALIPTVQRDAARHFYVDVLGFPLASEDDYAFEVDAGGVRIRVTDVPSLTPQPFSLVAFEVDDLDRAVDDLVAAGVVFERYRSLAQDGRGIWLAPSGTRVAWCEDPDGNVVSFTERPVTSASDQHLVQRIQEDVS